MFRTSRFTPVIGSFLIGSLTLGLLINQGMLPRFRNSENVKLNRSYYLEVQSEE